MRASFFLNVTLKPTDPALKSGEPNDGEKGSSDQCQGHDTVDGTTPGNVPQHSFVPQNRPSQVPKATGPDKT